MKENPIKKKNNNKIYIIVFVAAGIILYLFFSYLIYGKDKYNYGHIKGNSYIANDNSYLVLNDDKTFYWYKDKDNKDSYYYGKYSVYRGENAINYITSQMSAYEITEEEQRKTIENIDIKNAKDHYYLLNLNNERVFENGKEAMLFKETRYYGFATQDYDELDFLNVDAQNYAIFTLDE